jgi:hypothetical protein
MPFWTSKTLLGWGIKWQDPSLPSLPVTAIFHDPLTVDDVGLFNSLGCKTGNSGPLLEKYSIPTTPAIPLTYHPTFHLDSRSLFLSTAKFQNVKRIVVRQVKDRCIGLWIEHDDGFVDIFGQWDPPFPLQISPLYSSEQGQLTGICFYCKQYHSMRAEEEDEDAEDAADVTRFVNEIRIQVDGQGQAVEPSNDRKVFNHTDLSQVC